MWFNCAPMGEPHHKVRFELQRYPVVILRMPQAGTFESIHEWYDTVERILREAQSPVALVHDLRALELMSVTARHRAVVAERTLGLKHAGLEARIGADARIVTNPIVAGAVTVVSWLTGTTPWPQGTFTSEPEAVVWCQKALGVARSSEDRASRDRASR